MGVLLRLLLRIGILLATAWGALALPFVGPGAESVRQACAIGFALLGAAALVASFVGRRGRPIGLAFGAALLAVIGLWARIEPSNERTWQADVARTPWASFEGDLVTLHEVRNFEYRTETDYTPVWTTRTVDLSKLSSVDLVASYWMGPHIAHLFLTYGFSDGQHVAISIETRKEVGESYSTLGGFFRQYELYYVVGDERDVIGVRTNYRENPPEDVYVYQIPFRPDAARSLFLDYLREINALHDRPEFYNTATTNCTTNILMHTRVNPGSLPLSWKVLLSGHTPEYAYEMGRLDTRLPFEELQRRSRINDAARAADGAPDFSQRIRAALP